MPAEARLDLAVWRNDDLCEIPIRVRGRDLTGDDLLMEVRLVEDTPGVPLISLAKVDNGNAEGLRVAGVSVENGVPVTDLRLRFNKSTRQVLPYAGELGQSASFRYALSIAKKTRLVGGFTVLAHAIGSNNAPMDRPVGYGLATAGSGASSGATLTIVDNEVTELVLDGADLIGAEVLKAAGSATSSAASAVTAQKAAADIVQQTAAKSLNYDPQAAATTGNAAFAAPSPTGYTLTHAGTLRAAGMTEDGFVDQFTVYAENVLAGVKLKVLRVNADDTVSWVTDILVAGAPTVSLKAGENVFDFSAVAVKPEHILAVFEPAAGMSLRTGQSNVGRSIMGDFTGANQVAGSASSSARMFKARIRYGALAPVVQATSAKVGADPASGYMLVTGDQSASSTKTWLLPMAKSDTVVAVGAYFGTAGTAAIVVGKPATNGYEIVYVEPVTALSVGASRFALATVQAVALGWVVGIWQGTGKVTTTFDGSQAFINSTTVPVVGQIRTDIQSGGGTNSVSMQVEFAGSTVSDRLNAEPKRGSTTLFDQRFRGNQAPADWVGFSAGASTGAIAVNNGYACPAAAGFGSEKWIAQQDRYTYANRKITRMRARVTGTTSEFGIGFQSDGSRGGLFTLNLAAGQLRAYEWFTNGTNAVAASVALGFVPVAGRTYALEVERNRFVSTFKVTDTLTGASVTLSLRSRTIHHNGKVCAVFVSTTAGSVVVERMASIVRVQREGGVILAGASNTEGTAIGPLDLNTGEALDRLRGRGDVSVHAMYGDTTAGMLARLPTDVGLYRPRFVIYQFASNDNDVATVRGGWQAAIDAANAAGAQAIMCALPPRADKQGFTQAANADLRSGFYTGDYRVASFDRAVTLNNDGTNWDPRFLADAGVHLNQAGHLQCLRQLLIDVPELLD